MTETIRFTLLGTGCSLGVPSANGDWGICDPTESRNSRLRCSLLIERANGLRKTSVVIDCGPDFRQQMRSNYVTHIDGVVFTHAHADHINGIDDLRAFSYKQKQEIKIYAGREDFREICGRFSYCFDASGDQNYPPVGVFTEIESERKLVIDGAGGPITLIPYSVKHGSGNAFGFQLSIGDSTSRSLLYTPDINGMSSRVLRKVRGVDVWIVDALRWKSQHSHFSVADVVKLNEEMQSRRVVLTHMSAEIDYESATREIPPGFEVGYDNLTLEFALPIGNFCHGEDVEHVP